MLIILCTRDNVLAPWIQKLVRQSLFKTYTLRRGLGFPDSVRCEVMAATARYHRGSRSEISLAGSREEKALGTPRKFMSKQEVR